MKIILENKVVKSEKSEKNLVRNLNLGEKVENSFLFKRCALEPEQVFFSEYNLRMSKGELIKLIKVRHEKQVFEVQKSLKTSV